MSASFDLRDVAGMLKIDVRTLRKRMDWAGIVPVRDEHDRRRWLLDEGQLEQLQRLVAIEGERTTGLVGQVEQMKERIRELEQRVSELEAR
jgi:hypothetical protein